MMVTQMFKHLEKGKNVQEQIKFLVQCIETAYKENMKFICFDLLRQK